jgi:hypothetical protein
MIDSRSESAGEIAMNFGGFSWRRFFGISAFKSRVSRKIGIPLTASGRRRKLGASIFSIFGAATGTVAVAAIAAATSKRNSTVETPSKAPTKTKSPTGVHFCVVKGVTHGTHADSQRLCSIGDVVRLVPEPNNEHDKNAIRVLLQGGQEIGYISARQAERFAGQVHLLSATVHARVSDDWGNETVKLRVVNSAEQQAHEGKPVATKGQPRSFDPLSAMPRIQAETKDAANKGHWQSAFIYFENAERGLYQVVLSSNTEHIRQTLREGLVQVGFVGGRDTPKGINWEFALNDGLPTDGVVAKRFVTNAREFIVTRSKDLCAQKGLPAPVVHKFEPTKS